MTPVPFDPARSDVAVLAKLHAASFPNAWTAPAIRALLAGPGAFAFHLPDGFILARVAAGEAEILTLAVKPEARRHGHGRALLHAAAAHAHALGGESMFLEVATDNVAALALYEAAHFTPVGARKAYYGAGYGAGGGDAWVLKAQLPLPPATDFP